MNIYFRELKAHRKSLIIWSVGMIFLIAASMGKYSAGAGVIGGGFNEMMAKMPKSLQNLFGVGVFDLSKALDYFGVMFLYLALVATAHAAMLGAGIISKEERDKTVEFLLVKPVSRSQIITAKLFSALTILLVFNLVTYITSYSMLIYYSKSEPFSYGLFKLMLALFALQLLFAALGTFLAACLKRPKLAASAATGVLMVTFIIYILAELAPDLKLLRFATPYKYFDAKELLKGGYSAVYPIITLVLIALLIWGTYHFFKKRDMKI